MSPFAVAAVATALLAQGAPGPKPTPAPGEVTLTCRIKGSDRVRFHLSTAQLRARPASNPKLHYGTLRVTGIERQGARVNASTLAAIDAQMQTFRPLQGGAHVVCGRQRATLVILGWQDKTPVRLELRAPAKGLANFPVGPTKPGWTT